MPNSILSSFFSESALTITNSTTGAVVMPTFKVKRVRISFRAQPMPHRREDGATIIDSRIILPTNLSIEGFCTDITSLDQVNKVLLDRQAFYSISSKGIQVASMMIDTDNSSQTSEMLSATPKRLTFRQVLVQNVTPVICQQSSDSSVVNKGIAALDTAKQSVVGLYNKIASI